MLNTLPVTSVLDCTELSPDHEPLWTAARSVTLCGVGNTYPTPSWSTHERSLRAVVPLDRMPSDPEFVPHVAVPFWNVWLIVVITSDVAAGASTPEPIATSTSSKKNQALRAFTFRCA